MYIFILETLKQGPFLFVVIFALILLNPRKNKQENNCSLNVAYTQIKSRSLSTFTYFIFAGYSRCYTGCQRKISIRTILFTWILPRVLSKLLITFIVSKNLYMQPENIIEKGFKCFKTIKKHYVATVESGSGDDSDSDLVSWTFCFKGIIEFSFHKN